MSEKPLYHLTIDCDSSWELQRIASIAHFIQVSDGAPPTVSYGNLPEAIWVLLQDLHQALQWDDWWRAQDCAHEPDRSEWESVVLEAKCMVARLESRLAEQTETD